MIRSARSSSDQPRSRRQVCAITVDRLRLPGRRARRGDGRASAMRSSACDVDTDKWRRCPRAAAPFFEPGLPELLDQAYARRRLRFSPTRGARGADVHFVCVGTPQRPGLRRRPPVRRRRRALAARGRRRGDLVVGKSTVPVGHRPARRLAAGRDPGPCSSWNPEFLREGYAVQTRSSRTGSSTASRTARPTIPRSRCSTRSTRSIIARGTPTVVTDFPTAELVKVAANSFLATKICSSTRWPRSARSPAPTSSRSPTRSDTTRGSAAVPQRRAGLRWRLPAEGHPRVHRPGGGARRRPGGRFPQESTRSTNGAGAHGRPRARGAATAVRRPARSRSSAPRSSRTATTCGTRRRSTSPTADGARRRRRRHRPRGAATPASVPPPDLRSTAEEAVDGADAVLLLTEWAAVPRARPGQARRPGTSPAHRRRAQRSGSGGVENRPVDISRPGPPFDLGRKDVRGVRGHRRRAITATPDDRRPSRRSSRRRCWARVTSRPVRLAI